MQVPDGAGQPIGEYESSEGVYEPRKLYIPNLGMFSDQTAAEDWAIEHFSRFGPIIDFKVLYHRQEQCFGFVTFLSEESLLEALHCGHGVGRGELIATRIRVDRPPSSAEGYVKDVLKIFVCGLPNKCTPSEFRNYFLRFGKIKDLCIPSGKDGNFGFRFVTFKSTESVQKVFEFERHSIRGKSLDVKIAKPRRSNSPNFKVLNKQNPEFCSK